MVHTGSILIHCNFILYNTDHHYEKHIIWYHTHILVMVSTIMKKHHEHDKSQKGNHLVGAGLQF